MQLTCCNRCGSQDTTQPAMLRGERLDLCEPCTDLAVGDRAEWQSPPPMQGDGGGRGISRPPVHGTTADELDPDHAARREAQSQDHAQVEGS